MAPKRLFSYLVGQSVLSGDYQYYQSISSHSRSEDRHRHLHRLNRLHRVERRLLGPRRPLLHAPEQGVEPGQPRDEGSRLDRAGCPSRRLQHLPGRRPSLRL